MITVRETTQLGHVVNVVDDPAGSGLLESFANQVFGRALDHSATDRLAGVESMAVVETFCMRGEIARPIIHCGADVRAVVRRQRLTHMVAKAGPAVGQQKLASPVQPFIGGRPLATQTFGCGIDVLGGVVNVEELATAARSATGSSWTGRAMSP